MQRTIDELRQMLPGGPGHGPGASAAASSSSGDVLDVSFGHSSGGALCVGTVAPVNNRHVKEDKHLFIYLARHRSGGCQSSDPGNPTSLPSDDKSLYDAPLSVVAACTVHPVLRAFANFAVPAAAPCQIAGRCKRRPSPWHNRRSGPSGARTCPGGHEPTAAGGTGAAAAAAPHGGRCLIEDGRGSGPRVPRRLCGGAAAAAAVG